MSKPIGGARKSIKNQEGQGMLDIDENTSVEDDMFENVKTDEDMDHEMEEEEGGSAFEEEIDPDESDQQEQAVIRYEKVEADEWALFHRVRVKFDGTWIRCNGSERECFVPWKATGYGNPCFQGRSTCR